MKLTKEEAEARLSNPTSSSSEQLNQLSLEVKTLRQGRKSGDLGYPAGIRAAVGALGRLIGPTKAALESGMTQSNASYLKRAHSSSQRKKDEIEESIQSKLWDSGPSMDWFDSDSEKKSLIPQVEEEPDKGWSELVAEQSESLPDLWQKKEKQLDSRIVEARNQALDKLVLSLSSIEPTSLVGEKPKILAGIAKDLAGVVKLTNPEGGNNGVKVIINTVNQKEEDFYETIEIQM